MANTVTITGNIIEVVFDGPQSYVTVETTLVEVSLFAACLFGKNPYYILADISRVHQTTLDARKAVQELIGQLNVKMAAIVTNDIFIKHVVSLLLKMIDLRYKVKFFAHRGEAMQWLYRLSLKQATDISLTTS
jgi:hypothetical protein